MSLPDLPKGQARSLAREATPEERAARRFNAAQLVRGLLVGALSIWAWYTTVHLLIPDEWSQSAHEAAVLPIAIGSALLAGWIATGLHKREVGHGHDAA